MGPDTREGLAVQSDIAVSSPFILPHNKAPDVIVTVLVASLQARDLPWRASIASSRPLNPFQVTLRSQSSTLASSGFDSARLELLAMSLQCWVRLRTWGQHLTSAWKAPKQLQSLLRHRPQRWCRLQHPQGLSTTQH